ncbi:MAG: nucleotidyltransferase domain-containing protein [Coriobacteriia bacterium]|nr:nucleotidyltransferase domain-containing protein [Coriobacteriia bacterium]
MGEILDIGADLVRARRASGLSQRELGIRLGVRQQQVARWEATAYRTADLQRVDEVAQALGIERTIGTLPLAAETPAVYGEQTTRITPVRDLGEIVARIRAHGDEFRDRFHIDRIGVFGSFVHGEQTADSDVDLLVETDDPGGLRYVAAGNFAEDILGRPVDFIRPHLLKERLAPRVLREAVYVWTA